MKRQAKSQESQQRFSIKKYKFGAASVLVGTVFATFAGTVQAETPTTNTSTDPVSSVSTEASTSPSPTETSSTPETSSAPVESSTATDSSIVATRAAVETDTGTATTSSQPVAVPVTVEEPATTPTKPVDTRSASQGNFETINKVIYLDAGHGGSDPGAVYGGVREKDLTMTMHNLVKNQLEEAGYTVQSTRTSDATVGLTERSETANKTKADIFVSLHINASPSAAAKGIETYWYEYETGYPSRLNPTYHVDPERLKRSSYLANAIQTATVAKTGATNRGVLRNTFSVLRETTAPAVLVELCV